MASIPTPPTYPPSHDWAKDTTASISHVENKVQSDTDTSAAQQSHSPAHQTPDLTSTVPGYYFPAVKQSETADNSTHGVLDAAQQAFHDTAKQYLPESMMAYLRKAAHSSQCHMLNIHILSWIATTFQDRLESAFGGYPRTIPSSPYQYPGTR